MADAHKLLGKQVRVTLKQAPGRKIVEGQLLSFSDMGEFTILDESQDVHYCWPLLEIEEISPATP